VPADGALTRAQSLKAYPDPRFYSASLAFGVSVGAGIFGASLGLGEGVILVPALFLWVLFHRFPHWPNSSF
jgi:uncharacterized membrane protein YfcA